MEKADRNQVTIEIPEDVVPLLNKVCMRAKKTPEQIIEDALNHLFDKQMRDEARILSFDMVKIEVELSRPFYEFLKEFLQFRGSKESIGDVCAQVIYDHVRELYEQFYNFLAKLPQYIHGTNPWFTKWQEIAITIGDTAP